MLQKKYVKNIHYFTGKWVEEYILGAKFIVLHGKKDIFIKSVYYDNKNQQKDDVANMFAPKYMSAAGLEEKRNASF